MFVKSHPSIDITLEGTLKTQAKMENCG